MSARRLLAAGLVGALLAAGGCGKYGPPKRIAPAPAPSEAAAESPAPDPEKKEAEEARP